MVCLGAGTQSGVSRCPVRTLDCYAAVLVVAGAGRLEAGSRAGRPAASYELRAPALFWLFPGVPHTYGPDAHGWEEIWTLFDGPAAGAYEDLGYLARGSPVAPLPDPAAARHTAGRLVEACRAQRPGVEVEAAHLVHELVLTVQHTRADPGGARDAALLAALRDAACTPAPVAELAAGLGLSVSSLRRAVRAAAGCSPKEYLLRTRLSRAKALLADSDRTVAEVARAVGYDDPAYFTRAFTRRAGMSPSAFRTQQRRPGQDAAARAPACSSARGRGGGRR